MILDKKPIVFGISIFPILWKTFYAILNYGSGKDFCCINLLTKILLLLRLQLYHRFLGQLLVDIDLLIG